MTSETTPARTPADPPAKPSAKPSAKQSAKQSAGGTAEPSAEGTAPGTVPSTVPDAALAGGTSGPEPAALVAMEADPRFAELRGRFRSFVFPMTVAFLVWYLLYVLLSAYARGFMARQVAGNVNVALVFGLLQFASTFLIAWGYSRFARRRLDPLATELREELR